MLSLLALPKGDTDVVAKDDAGSGRRLRKRYRRAVRRSRAVTSTRDSALAVAVDDASAVEVVRRELDLHSVAEEDLDAVAPHLPGGIAERLVSVVELDSEHSIAEGFDDLALQLEFLFLAGDNGSFRSELKKEGRGRRSGHDLGRGLADRGVDGRDVDRLGALRALALFELDARTLGEALEAFTGDIAVVHEEILRALVR